ncbi:hypothetical protein [Natrinema soli]|uniref:Uncharacterized protein n=1 Tax=Natrinema soli TaxID=1930624 RepID=A0ABD5SU00_9EURY|nr:hypothetical protein [Natrinema soli]
MRSRGDVIEECAEAGIGGTVIFASGFAEAGEDVRQLQEYLVDAATAGDVYLLGPNTSGFLVPEADLYATFATDVKTIPAGADSPGGFEARATVQVQTPRETRREMLRSTGVTR